MSMDGAGTSYASKGKRIRAAIDVGGTFTDVFILDSNGKQTVAKVPSVRRQGFWDNRRRELTEALAHQVCHIRPLHLDEASGAV